MRIISIFVLSTLVACGPKAPESVVTAAAPSAPLADATALPRPTPHAPHAHDHGEPSPLPDEPLVKPTLPKALEDVGAMLDAWARGDLEQAFAKLSDDVLWHAVGQSETPDLRGRSAVVAHERARVASLTAPTMVATRVLDTANARVIEYVLAAKVTARGPDGTARLMPVALPCALVLMTNQGLVTEAWSFQDDALALQQAGILSGLTGELTPPSLPREVTHVTGEARPEVATTWQAFADKRTPATMMELGDLVGDHVEAHARTGVVVDRKTFLAELEQAARALGEVTRESLALSSGEFHAVLATTTGRYRARLGNLEVPPVGQSVKLTTLEVVRIAEGRIAAWRSYGNDLELTRATAPVEAPSAPPPTTGAPACDGFATAMRACLAAAPADIRQAQEKPFEDLVTSWGAMADKTKLDAFCKDLRDNSKAGLAKVCPDVKWD
jgi:ketosteroid isomerase-like protein